MPTIARVERKSGQLPTAPPQTSTVNVDALPESEKQTFARLFAAAQGEFGKPPAPPRPGVGDAGIRRVTIETDGVAHTGTWSDAALPSACRELALWIESRGER